MHLCDLGDDSQLVSGGRLLLSSSDACVLLAGLYLLPECDAGVYVRLTETGSEGGLVECPRTRGVISHCRGNGECPHSVSLSSLEQVAELESTFVFLFRFKSLQLSTYERMYLGSACMFRPLDPRGVFSWTI